MTGTDFSVQEFVSIVSHDLRAPIRHLRQFSVMLADSVTAPTEEQKQYSEFIRDSARQCNQMMDALTELSRLYTRVSDAEAIDFTVLLTEVCADLAIRSDCQPLLKINNRANHLPFMDAEHARVLMLELVENAFKYRYRGDELALQLDIANVDGQHVIQLTDNGIGIVPHFIDHCTTMFKQLDKNMAGVGSGLALVEAIARLSGGSVNIESSTQGKQRGTKVTVVLPLQT